MVRDVFLVTVSLSSWSYPVDVVVLVLPVAHVEGDDRDANVLGRLAMDIRQLEPGVVLLLPGLQCVLS